MQSISLHDLFEWKEQRAYFCYPFLPTDGTMFFAAPPKHYKTLLAMQFAYALASGEDWLGWKIDKPVERVLYIEQEIGRSETRDRMARIHKQFMRPDVASRIRFVTRPKQRFSLDRGSKGFKELEDEIIEFQPQVVFIDPFRKATSHDENSSTEMTKVFASLTALQEIYKFAVVLIHHSGKPNESRKQGTPEAMRGSSEIFAHGDTYAMITKPNDKQDANIDVHFTFRHAPNMEPFKLEFSHEGIFKRRSTPVVERVKKEPLVSGALSGLKLKVKDIKEDR